MQRPQVERGHVELALGVTLRGDGQWVSVPSRAPAILNIGKSTARLDIYCLYTYIRNMTEPRFEWDPDKDAENQRKHGVSFREASTAFRDEEGLL